MRGYVARKGDRWYVVVYEGLDPVTRKERRRWHPLAPVGTKRRSWRARLTTELNGRNDTVRSLFGAYLTSTWLPGKRIHLAPGHLGRVPDPPAPGQPLGGALRPDAASNRWAETAGAEDDAGSASTH